MEEAGVKLTKSGKSDKRSGKDGSSQQNVSRARQKINTLVSAGKSQGRLEDQLEEDPKALGDMYPKAHPETKAAAGTHPEP
jgi:hypothetical protein